MIGARNCSAPITTSITGLAVWNAVTISSPTAVASEIA